MGFLLESPAQLADSQVLHLSTPWGALQEVTTVHQAISRRILPSLEPIREVIVSDESDVIP
jgi:hypothetical protein